jgi:hypothetical protein
MVKVFYHNDPDGFCSAFWVRKWLESQKIEFTSSDFIEMNYDKQFPWEILTLGERIFMVDFSLNDPDDMLTLNRCYDFTWIDHHKTAIEKMNAVMDLHRIDIDGLRVDGIAACVLTWIYLHSEAKFNSIPITKELIGSAPLFTQYIHLWDTWQWKDHPDKDEIEEFITTMMAHTDFSDPISVYWDSLNNSKNNEALCELIQSGSAMLVFRDGYAKSNCDSIGRVIEFEGYRCFVCNMPKSNSEWYKSVDLSTYDILMPFYYNMQTKQFCVSLYSSGVDVSKIAVKYGAGGHRNAAGFQCEVLPW